MPARRHFATIKPLIRDTFRQAWASGISGIVMTATAICVVLCLSVSITGDSVLHATDEPGLFLPQPSPRTIVPSVVLVLGSSNPLEVASKTVVSQSVWYSLEVNPALARKEGIERISGRMTLAFGAMSFPIPREREDSVHFLEMLLALGIAGTLGLLLALVWTAGFAPTFLEPSMASVLLAKPAGRWQLLLGKYLGVLAFVGFQVTLFVVLTWLALGVRTNVWDLTYWWCIPLLMAQFAIFYSFSILLAVVTRSTVACVIGSLLFWLVAWGVNYGRVMALGTGDPQNLPRSTLALADAAYWISPKPIDAGLILFNALDAQHHFQKPEVFALLEAGQSFSPLGSILSSLIITGILLALSVYEFKATDY